MCGPIPGNRKVCQSSAVVFLIAPDSSQETISSGLIVFGVLVEGVILRY